MDLKREDMISELINKVKELSINTETTIADLIAHNSNVNFIEPLIQGQIFNEMMELCKKQNINIERIIDEERFTGMAFYYKFKRKFRN